MNPNDYQQNQPAPVIIPPQGNVQRPQGGMSYQFSAEELKVLKECNIESFYQRSLPLGVGLGVGTYLAVQRGILKPTGSYGAAPKIALAGILGYFIGKFSYQQKCAEKIMRLPNSRLAEALKRRKKGEFFENINPDGGLSLAPFSSATDVYTDEGLKQDQGTSLDLDLERPFNAGLDDTFRPSVDTPEREFKDNLPLEPKSSTTYEELRRRNREEYDKRMQNPYYKPISEEAAPVIRRSASQAEQQSETTTGPRNKYGDVILK